jgi:hypothetical protein
MARSWEPHAAVNLLSNHICIRETDSREHTRTLRGDGKQYRIEVEINNGWQVRASYKWQIYKNLCKYQFQNTGIHFAFLKTRVAWWSFCNRKIRRLIRWKGFARKLSCPNWHNLEEIATQVCGRSPENSMMIGATKELGTTRLKFLEFAFVLRQTACPGPQMPRHYC